MLLLCWVEGSANSAPVGLLRDDERNGLNGGCADAACHAILPSTPPMMTNPADVVYKTMRLIIAPFSYV